MSRTEFFSQKQSGGVYVVSRADLTPGNILFVHYANGTDGATRGANPDVPLKTLDYAIGLCTADKGDVIYVMPGHTETLSSAGAVTLDIAGITIIGLGNANLRPTFTLDTSTDADVNVAAANCKIKNLKFISDINSLKNFLDLDEGGFTCEDCIFVTSSTKEAVAFVDIASTYDDFVFLRCEFYQPTDPEGTDAAAGTGAIYLVDTEGIRIEDCIFHGYFETAIIHNKTTKCQRLLVKNCEITNYLIQPFILVADVTGQAMNCCGETVIGTDITDAELFGTIGTRFWVNNCAMGNDSAGGQAGAPGTAAS